MIPYYLKSHLSSEQGSTPSTCTPYRKDEDRMNILLPPLYKIAVISVDGQLVCLMGVVELKV